MNANIESPFGFKYVGDNYVLYSQRTGEDLACTDTCGSHPQKQRHLLYCYFRELNCTKESAFRLAERCVTIINEGE